MASGGVLVTRSEWSTQPWKNGGGVTHEIWRWTDPRWTGEREAGGFDLRLSVAEVEGAQPFSSFPGYHRTLVPLEDNDLRLVIGDASTPMTRHTAIHFPGDLPAATRGTGRATDLNVISRVARARAHVEISTSETHRHSPAIWPVTRARNLAVFALSETTLRGPARGARRALRPFNTLLHVEHDGHVAYTASAPVVWIRF